MTNQLQQSTNNQVKNLIQIRKSLARGKAGNLQENKAFLDFLAVQKQMTDEINETWDVVRDLMLDHDITKIDGEWGYIRLDERRTFKIDGKAAPRFLKNTVDGDIVKAWMKLHGDKLPAGIKQSVSSKFLTKKIKAVA